jgi:hypothetical protein
VRGEGEEVVGAAGEGSVARKDDARAARQRAGGGRRDRGGRGRLDVGQQFVGQRGEPRAPGLRRAQQVAQPVALLRRCDHLAEDDGEGVAGRCDPVERVVQVAQQEAQLLLREDTGQLSAQLLDLRVCQPRHGCPSSAVWVG